MPNDTVGTIAADVCPTRAIKRDIYPNLEYTSTELECFNFNLQSTLIICVCNMHFILKEGVKKNRHFLGKSPKLWVGGGQDS